MEFEYEASRNPSLGKNETSVFKPLAVERIAAQPLLAS
jgi:hypothetical protein